MTNIKFSGILLGICVLATSSFGTYEAVASTKILHQRTPVCPGEPDCLYGGYDQEDINVCCHAFEE